MRGAPFFSRSSREGGDFWPPCGPSNSVMADDTPTQGPRNLNLPALSPPKRGDKDGAAASSRSSATLRPPHRHQPPSLPILPQPPAPRIPMATKLRRLPSINRLHRNHKPRIARHHISHHKIDLRSIVRNHLPVSIPLQIHHVRSILLSARRLHLHPPQPLPHIQNKAIALAVPIRLSRSKSLLRRPHHKHHLCQFPALLAAQTDGVRGAGAPPAAFDIDLNSDSDLEKTLWRCSLLTLIPIPHLPDFVALPSRRQRACPRSLPVLRPETRTAQTRRPAPLSS